MIKLFKRIEEVPKDFVGKCVIIGDEKQYISVFSYNGTKTTGRRTTEYSWGGKRG